VNKANNIQDELQELSPTLAAIPKINVFSVPEGYFEQLPGLLLLQSIDNKFVTQGSVPEGYFDSLAGNIMDRIKAAGEAQAEPSEVLGKIGNTNVFSVPEGYFEQFPSTVMRQLMDSSVAQETSFSSPLVAGIGNKNVFTVPEGYFENFSVDTSAVSGARVVRMPARKSIWRYAAAAVITGFLAVGGYLLVNDNQPVGLTAETKQVIQEGQVILKTNSFDKEMNTVSDADIVAYLESNGQDVNAALVASLTDDAKDLPDATDYIIDDKTLDNMLNDLDLSN
jgi:hypothetical protein